MNRFSEYIFAFLSTVSLCTFSLSEGAERFHFIWDARNADAIVMTIAEEGALTIPEIGQWLGMDDVGRVVNLEATLQAIPGVREFAIEGTVMDSLSTRSQNWRNSGAVIPESIPEHRDFSGSRLALRIDENKRIMWHVTSDRALLLTGESPTFFETWPTFVRDATKMYLRRDCKVHDDNIDFVTVFTKSISVRCITVFRRADSSKLVEIWSSHDVVPEMILEDFKSQVHVYDVDLLKNSPASDNAAALKR